MLYPYPATDYMGSFQFGGINPFMADPSAGLTWAWSKTFDTTSNYWTIPLNGFLVNNLTCNSSANYAIIDSGTTGFIMTDADY